MIAGIPAPAGATSLSARTFSSYGYGDATARGRLATLSFFFSLPPGQVVRSGEITLDFSHAAILLPGLSTLTASVNGETVASTVLTPGNALHGHISFGLPRAAVGASTVLLQVQLLMRLSTHCEDPDNPALWTTIHGDSLLRVRTAAAPGKPRLSELPSLFPDGAAIVMSSLSDPATLQAAGLMAFQAGRWASRSDRPASLIAGTGAPPDWPVIQLGVRSRASRGLISVSGNPPRLSVTGTSGADLTRMAEALVRGEENGDLRGTGIGTGRHPTPLWANGASTFARLGVSQQQVEGTGSHTLSLTFSRPPEWNVQAPATLDLVILASPGLRTQTSWVRVTVNGVVIGTRRLVNEGNMPGHYRFELPADLLSTNVSLQPQRLLSLSLQFYLDGPSPSRCVSVPGSTAWATVLASSVWRLPHTIYRGLDVGRFPAPLFTADSPPALVVLPQRLSPVDLDLGLELMAAIGRWVPHARALPRLADACCVSARELAQDNLILLGGPPVNAVSARGSARAPDALTVLPVPQAFAAMERGPTAELRLSRSPWSKNRSMLVLLGNSADALTGCVRTLSGPDLLTSVRGRSVAILPGAPALTLQTADPPEAERQSLAPGAAEPIDTGPGVSSVLRAVGLVAAYAVAVALLVGGILWLSRER